MFASSVAPSAKSAKGKRADSSASARSATGDLWSGFKPAARASVFDAAENASAGQAGPGVAPAALALLGLGLTGVFGTLAAVAMRRRRVEARQASGSRASAE